MKYTFHEAQYRGRAVMATLQERSIVVCGAGALGANLAETLVRSGARRLSVIDHDRIEEVNLSTQPYERDDIGAKKAEALARSLYRAVGTEVEAMVRRLDERNARKLLGRADLVIDCFDNSVSRGVVTDVCRKESIDCLHVGLADGFAEVLWNEQYRVPSDTNDDVCDYPLARTLVMLAVAVAAETVMKFLVEGERAHWSVTLRDLCVKPMNL